MSYLELLELKEEPFSNSPDPEFFYESPQHLECLHRLEISIRLMRGLNVVLGEVGAGKSTLARLLLRNLNKDEKVKTYLLLDPHFSSSKAMLQVLYGQFVGEEPSAALTEWQLKEAVKNQLFKTAVEEDKLQVLLLDEGQKITHACLEVLRELLNYETNNTKLLQIVIFAQTEFSEMIRKYPNVADRINEYTTLGPLNYWQTRDLIRHRVKKAGISPSRSELFTPLGYLAVHRLSGGYPRKVIRLCHKIMLGCILNNKKRAGWMLVHACAKDVAAMSRTPKKHRLAYGAALGSFLLAGTLALFAHFASTPGSDVPGMVPAAPGSGGAVSSPKTMPGEHQQDLPPAPPAGTEGPTGLAQHDQQQQRDQHGTIMRQPIDYKKVKGAQQSQERLTKVPAADPHADIAAIATAGKADEASNARKVDETPTIEPLKAGQATPSAAKATNVAPSVAVHSLGTLGPLTITSDINVESLLQLVYGTVEPELVLQFHTLNPLFKQQSLIPAGTVVRLPERAFGAMAHNEAAYSVQITQDNSLQMAVDAVLGLQAQGLDVAIKRAEQDSQTPRYTIVQAKGYATEQAAVQGLRNLPSLFQAGAKIVIAMPQQQEATVASLEHRVPSLRPGATAQAEPVETAPSSISAGAMAKQAPASMTESGVAAMQTAEDKAKEGAVSGEHAAMQAQ